MIYTPLTNKALCLAYRAHHGHTDAAGLPYVFHPFHLAEQMPDEVSVCVALLHDVLEDTNVSLQELEREFPPEVTERVLLLTHRPDVDYLSYVRALAHDPVARAVKLADLAHNSDESRLTGCDIPAQQRAEQQKKYAQARALLMQAQG